MFIRTERNILKAYKGEARSMCAYRMFAQRADQEGHHQIARLFRAAAWSEGIHANWLLRGLRETSEMSNAVWEAKRCALIVTNGTTEENLRNAIGSEMLELLFMYPEMIRDAATDGWDFAHDCFTALGVVELVHVDLFSLALGSLGGDREAHYFVCESCGNTIPGEANTYCPICRAPSDLFQMVD